MKVKEESEKVGLKLNIQKTEIMASRPITSWQIDEETVETVADFIFWCSKITADGDCSHEIKRRLLLGRKVMINLDSILKSRERRQRWWQRQRPLWRPQSRSWLRPQPHPGDARWAAGAPGRPPGHGLGLLHQHWRACRGVLQVGHLGHQDGPHLRGGRGRLPGHQRGDYRTW